MEPTLNKIESALLLNTTGNGKTIIDRLNELEKTLHDAKTQLDLSVDEKLSRRVN